MINEYFVVLFFVSLFSLFDTTLFLLQKQFSDNIQKQFSDNIYASIIWPKESFFLDYKKIDYKKKDKDRKISSDVFFFGQQTKQQTVDVFYDTKSDFSYQKYVNKYIGFENTWYVPPDLVILQNKYIVTTKPFMKLRKQAAEALYAMASDFYHTMGAKIVVQSAYRTFSQQRLLWLSDKTRDYVAPPGHSEHQWWFAVDLFHVGTKESFFRNKKYTKYYERLVHNAHLYWFHNTYQKGTGIDTYLEEPWHRRYLWTGLATELYTQNLTFGERFQQNQNKENWRFLEYSR